MTGISTSTSTPYSRAFLAIRPGPTRTHALLEGSAAIDVAGECFPATDQRRFRRDDRCDSGAFEFGAEGLGGLVSGITPKKVLCKNLTTGQKKKISTNGSAWLCDDLGVTAARGDRVRLSAVGIVDGTTAVGGSVSGRDQQFKPRVMCKNRTSGKKVAFVSESSSWSCETRGLLVESGDSVLQKIRVRF